MDSHLNPAMQGGATKTRQLYATLMLGSLALAVPQHEMHTLEPVLDIETAEPEGMRIGSIALAGSRWPVYCLSANLEAASVLPATWRICVMLGATGTLFGIVCEMVAMIDGAEIQSFSMPTCMSHPMQPIRALALYQEQVLCITTANDLIDFMAPPASLSDPHGDSQSLSRRPII
jgi:hypothetical protein